jgi:thiol-disulfide isomerase/thioredoxin
MVLAAAWFGASTVVTAEVSEEQMRTLFAPNLAQADLEKAVAEGAKAGIPAQTIAEAKLVWGLRHQDTAFLEKCLPELEAAAKGFKKENSVSLGSPEDYLGLLSYIKALVALRKDDEDGFKKFITEAFWLSPDQAQLFSQTITNHRTKKKMSAVKVDMKTSVTTSTGESTTLEKQLGKNKAILLDFWASWCGPCMEGLPELKKRAAYLSKHGIVVAGMNTEGDESIAEKIRKEKGMDLPWLVEPKEKPLSDLLEINTIPHVVLLSPDGKVLFHGFPDEGELWTALKALDAAIEPMKAEPETK